MDCPTEETLIRKKLGGMSEVSALEFNLMQRMLTVEHVPDAQPAIESAIRSLGMTPEAAAPGALAARVADAPAKPWWPLALAGVAAIASEGATGRACPYGSRRRLRWRRCSRAGHHVQEGLDRDPQRQPEHQRADEHRGDGRDGDRPVAGSRDGDGAVHDRRADRSEVAGPGTQCDPGLMQLAPDTATVQDADGSWRTIEAAQVALGAVVRVKPGERIGLDGEVVAGRSTVNGRRSPASLPVERRPATTPYAGTINESGLFDYRVTAVAANSTLARIIHAVEEAQGAKAPTQRFVDQFARVYTPVVFAVALLVAVAPPLVMGGAWHDWIYRALVLLVIACPCALVISTPVTIVSGRGRRTTRDSREGRRVPGRRAQLAWLALDKTGTITHGKPVQTDFDLHATDADEARVRHSEREPRGALRSPGVAGDRSRGARRGHDGIRRCTGLRSDRRARRAARSTARATGSATTGSSRNSSAARRPLEAKLDALERQGKSVVVLVDEARVLGIFAVADTIKDTSREAIADLHALGIRTAMLTGDNPHTAQAIAQQAGIDDARGNQLPEDKLAAVEELSAGGAARSGWSATGSTTRRRSRAPTSASRWARWAPTRRSRRPTSR